MGRAPCCDKANVKKGPWSPEEDATLKTYIEKNGTGGNWIALPQKIGKLISLIYFFNIPLKEHIFIESKSNTIQFGFGKVNFGQYNNHRLIQTLLMDTNNSQGSRGVERVADLGG